MAKTNFPLESSMPTESNIQDLIYVIRGQQVMLDRDLANLYGVETAQLNRQVKRNSERFPDDFMFQLNKEEAYNLKCQFGISRWGGDRHLPFVFTENGVAMLSGVLIDNYIDETVLTLLDKRSAEVQAVIYTQQISRQLQLDIDRHNAQYPPIEVNLFRLSHDRFLCIDEVVYHVGASIKDLGKKWFGFPKMKLLGPEELVERINR